MTALKRDAIFVGKVLVCCAIAGVGLVLTLGPLIVFARIQCG